MISETSDFNIVWSFFSHCTKTSWFFNFNIWYIFTQTKILFLVELHLEHNSIKGVENPDNLKNQSSGHPFKLSFIIFLTCLAKLFKLFFVSYPRRPKIVFLIIHIDIQIKHCLSWSKKFCD